MHVEPHTPSADEAARSLLLQANHLQGRLNMTRKSHHVDAGIIVGARYTLAPCLLTKDVQENTSHRNAHRHAQQRASRLADSLLKECHHFENAVHTLPYHSHLRQTWGEGSGPGNCGVGEGASKMMVHK